MARCKQAAGKQGQVCSGMELQALLLRPILEIRGIFRPEGPADQLKEEKLGFVYDGTARDESALSLSPTSAAGRLFLVLTSARKPILVVRRSVSYRHYCMRNIARRGRAASGKQTGPSTTRQRPGRTVGRTLALARSCGRTTHTPANCMSRLRQRLTTLSSPNKKTSGLVPIRVRRLLCATA